MAGAASVLPTPWALLWVAQGEGALSAAALQGIDAAPVGSIVAISGCVMDSKVQQGTVPLPVLPAHWLAAVLAHPTREGLTFHRGICLRSTALPASHADPGDRMMIAAAQVYHMPVVTTDPLFVQYGIEVIT